MSNHHSAGFAKTLLHVLDKICINGKIRFSILSIANSM